MVKERTVSEKEDDAKPDYLTEIIDSKGRERISHSDITITDWEKVEKESLRRVLRNIYDARSKLVHECIRLPANIIIGHFRGIPIEALVETIGTSQKNLKKHVLQIPPLLTFERLVSYSMVEFLRKQQDKSTGHTKV